MLPEELLAAPPGDSDLAAGLIKSNMSLFRGMIVVAVLAPAIVILRTWFKYGPDSVMGAVSLALGLMALLAILAVALRANSSRSLRLYREGVATVGTVYRTEAAADRRDSAYGIVKVKYQDSTGCTRYRQVVAMSAASAFGAIDGEEVAVLYLTDKPKIFAVYRPGMGLVSGTVRN